MPQVLSVLVVSLGCLIHGTSVVFGIYAIMGLAGDSSNTTDTDINNNGTGGLGFEFDIVRDSSWLSEYKDTRGHMNSFNKDVTTNSYCYHSLSLLREFLSLLREFLLA